MPTGEDSEGREDVEQQDMGRLGGRLGGRLANIPLPAVPGGKKPLDLNIR